MNTERKLLEWVPFRHAIKLELNHRVQASLRDTPHRILKVCQRGSLVHHPRRPRKQWEILFLERNALAVKESIEIFTLAFYPR